MLLIKLSRYLSNGEKFISNLSSLFASKNIESIIALYPNGKIAEQRTLHLKVIKLHTENKSFLLKRLLNNNLGFRMMIEDLLKDFKGFTVTETSDFLSFYRRALSAGCAEIMTDSQYKQMKTHLMEFQMVRTKFFSFKTTLFYNLCTLNIKNDSVINNLSDDVYNMKISDVTQILHCMNMNPLFYDKKIIDLISQNSHLYFNNLASVSDLLKVINEYASICETYNTAPVPEIKSKCIEIIEKTVKSNPLAMLDIMKFSNFTDVETFFNQYFPTFIHYSSKHLNNPWVCCMAAHLISKYFQDDPLQLQPLYKSLKRIFSSDPTAVSQTLKSKVLQNMTQSKHHDLLLADLCIDHRCLSNGSKLNFIRNFVYYPEISGKPLQQHPIMDGKQQIDVKKICKDLDAIHISSALKGFEECPTRNEEAMKIRDMMIEEVMERARGDQRIAEYYYILFYHGFRLGRTDIHKKILKEFDGMIGDKNFVSKREAKVS